MVWWWLWFDSGDNYREWGDGEASWSREQPCQVSQLPLTGFWLVRQQIITHEGTNSASLMC